MKPGGSSSITKRKRFSCLLKKSIPPTPQSEHRQLRASTLENTRKSLDNAVKMKEILEKRRKSGDRRTLSLSLRESKKESVAEAPKKPGRVKAFDWCGTPAIAAKRNALRRQVREAVVVVEVQKKPRGRPPKKSLHSPTRSASQNLEQEAPVDVEVQKKRRGRPPKNRSRTCTVGQNLEQEAMPPSQAKKTSRRSRTTAARITPYPSISTIKNTKKAKAATASSPAKNTTPRSRTSAPAKKLSRSFTTAELAQIQSAEDEEKQAAEFADGFSFVFQPETFEPEPEELEYAQAHDIRFKFQQQPLQEEQQQPPRSGDSFLENPLEDNESMESVPDFWDI